MMYDYSDKPIMIQGTTPNKFPSTRSPTNYIRANALPFTCRFVVQDNNGAQTPLSAEPVVCRPVIYRGVEREVVLAGPWLTWDGSTPIELVIAQDPTDGVEPLVLTVEVAPEWEDRVCVVSMAIYVGDIPDPTIPRWVATTGLRSIQARHQGLGYVWYPGEHAATPAARYKAIIGTEWDYDEPQQNFYWQDIAGFASHRPPIYQFTKGPSILANPHNAPPDLIDAGHGQLAYHVWNALAPAGLELWLHRDGPRGVGRVGYPCSGYVLPDHSAIIASAPGRISRVTVHGDVETIVGWRIREGQVDNMAKSGPMSGRDYEFVGEVVEGQPWEHIWDVRPDPANPHLLYVANTHGQCINQFDTQTGKLSVFVGSLNAERGYVDAIGHEARFANPRGVEFGPDGNLYIGDAVNHAIRVVDMATREVTTLVQSADMDQHHVAHAAGLEGARDWCRDGAFGEARFIHPLHVRFLSDGCIVTSMHHQLQLVEFNLETRMVRTLTDLKGPGFKTQDSVWFSLAVDDGKTGPRDTIYFGPWNGPMQIYDREGQEVAVFGGDIDRTPVKANQLKFDGPWSYRKATGYNQLAFAGHGALWTGHAFGSGLFRITNTAAGETVDSARFGRGEMIWYHAPKPLQPSLALIHGCEGLNSYGVETADDLAMMLWDEFEDWLADRYPHYQLDDEQLGDLRYYIKQISISGRGLSLDGEPPSEPDPEPDPEPEPEPDPEPDPEEPIGDKDLEEVRAGIQEARAGLDRMEAGLIALVERLT
jgi:hypothetical protein